MEMIFNSPANEKPSPVLKTPHKICIVVKDCSVTSHSRSQEQNISQKVSVTLQWNIKCSMDSTSFLQNVHNGESNVYKTTKIKAYLDWRQIQLFSKRDHNGTSFQSSPKINRILIKWQLLSYSILICKQWKLTRIDEQTNKVEVPTLTLWIHSRGKRQTFFSILLC